MINSFLVSHGLKGVSLKWNFIHSRLKKERREGKKDRTKTGREFSLLIFYFKRYFNFSDQLINLHPILSEEQLMCQNILSFNLVVCLLSDSFRDSLTPGFYDLVLTDGPRSVPCARTERVSAGWTVGASVGAQPSNIAPGRSF